MKKYIIQGTDTSKQYLEVLKEEESGFQVMITRFREDWKQQKEDFMPRELFETCVRTHYLTEITA